MPRWSWDDRHAPPHLVCAVLRVRPRALCVLGKQVHLLHPSPFLCVLCVHVRVHSTHRGQRVSLAVSSGRTSCLDRVSIVSPVCIKLTTSGDSHLCGLPHPPPCQEVWDYRFALPCPALHRHWGFELTFVMLLPELPPQMDEDLHRPASRHASMAGRGGLSSGRELRFQRVTHIHARGHSSN